MRRAWLTLLAATGVTLATVVPAVAPASAAALAPAQVRVNQVGYPANGPKVGRGNIQLGATTDGPSSPSNFVGLGTVDGMRACSAGHFAPFNTKTAAYEDNAVSWPSVEPADDYTANSLLAFALGAAGLG